MNIDNESEIPGSITLIPPEESPWILIKWFPIYRELTKVFWDSTFLIWAWEWQ